MWDRNTKFDDLVEFMEVASRATSVLQWSLGDAMDAGETLFGEEWSQIADITGHSLHTLQNYRSVCRKFKLHRRNEHLSFYHHEAVASLPEDMQDYWLKQACVPDADGNTMSVHELRLAVKGDRPTRPTLPQPATTYAAGNETQARIEQASEQQSLLDTAPATTDDAGDEYGLVHAVTRGGMGPSFRETLEDAAGRDVFGFTSSTVNLPDVGKIHALVGASISTLLESTVTGTGKFVEIARYDALFDLYEASHCLLETLAGANPKAINMTAPRLAAFEVWKQALAQVESI